MVFRLFFYTVCGVVLSPREDFCEDVSTVNWRGERLLVRGVKGFENLESLVWFFWRILVKPVLEGCACVCDGSHQFCVC